MKNITIKSNHDLKGKLWLPKNAKKGIVVVHQFKESSEHPTCFEATKSFYKKGYAVLTFDLLGHGKSKGSLRDVSYRTTSENVSDAIKYLKEQGVSKVGVYAVSLGTIATILSSERPDTQVFVSPAPIFNLEGLLERDGASIKESPEKIEEQGYAIATSSSGRGNFKIGKEWLDEMKKERREIHQKHMENKTPTLIIQGTHDELTNINEARNLTAYFGDSSLFLDGADHNLTNPLDNEFAISKAGEWFERYLN